MRALPSQLADAFQLLRLTVLVGMDLLRPTRPEFRLR